MTLQHCLSEGIDEVLVHDEFVSGISEHLLDYILLIYLSTVYKFVVEFSDEFCGCQGHLIELVREIISHML